MPEDLNLVNKLYYGDNLIIMREFIPDECVDLIYLDPPFNSKATYNVLFHEKDGSDSPAQITAFEDTWHWDMAAAATYEELVKDGPAKLSDLVQALRSFLGTNDMMAYLTMMAVRLVEMRRVLKKTGSIYLHCDPTASHYLKLVMDAIFGVKSFRNEIIWKRSLPHNDPKRYGSIHDTILFYSKGSDFIFNQQHTGLSDEYMESHYSKVDDEGRHYQLTSLAASGPGPARLFGDKTLEPPPGNHWRYSQEKIDELMKQGRIVFTSGGKPRYIRYMDEMKGPALQSIWTDIYAINSQASERLGYPTQKPEALLERIIKASSNEGDLVMDPFCGCGTTIAVAEKLHRRWIGIDVTHLAITLMEHRLVDAFGEQLAPYQVIGDPKDVGGARALAESNRHQFEWWALSLVEARPGQDKKKGSDKGIDGYINFFDDESGKAKKIVVQVKSGHVSVHQVRDLCHVVDREKAAIGVLVSLDKPTSHMKEEAAGFGFYTPEHYPDRQYPRMQLLTVEELLAGAEVKYPKTLAPQATFKTAAPKKKAPKSGDKGHPEAMFEDGLLEQEEP
jgi:site-specific DNA-methyltransferase (adenine-specific)